MKYGSIFQVVEQMEKIIMVVMAMVIKYSDLEKKKEKNKMGSKQR
jgi:hypothetical protein